MFPRLCSVSRRSIHLSRRATPRPRPVDYLGPSRRLSNMLEPQSLMMDLESEFFNSTTGRFLYVSCILSCLCSTRYATYSVPPTLITSESAGWLTN
ncbi:hypothetical protein DFJ43DRAFT_26674 [Lentinula guzmanii]|uniref:Uncharacterized protein n=1 Tax=Lentinula guzmanii TaxID=2804957 RepID=A0AA38JWS6_9AGAR|nr:hypothetical protein DFJ43DRAFT_26674 [Lentinula guzmanii]